jgi:hypothetical protein
MLENPAVQKLKAGQPVRRRGMLALLGSAPLLFTARRAAAAEARLGRKVAQAIGPAEADRLVQRYGADVAALDATALHTCCASDFRAGHTLIVGGALVARTEAVRWLLAAGYTRA